MTMTATIEATKERNNVSIEDRWNVEALYPSIEAWEEDFKEWGREGQKPRFPEIAAFRGKLKESPSELRALIETVFAFDRHLTKLYTYAHLRHDEDVAADVYKKNYGRVVSVLHDLREEASWIEPEILAMPEDLLQSYLKAQELQEYRIYLEKIIRLKPHTLSADKEQLLAIAGKALDASQKAFSAFNNADLKFPAVEDSAGHLKELTHGKYLLYMRSKDRKLREGAFKAVHKSFLSYENTLCELIEGEVQKHLFETRARNYSSCLETALFPYQIDTKVYTALIEAVRSRLTSLHRYIKVRQKILGYEKLHLYDLYVPLVPDVQMSMKYSEAEQLVIDSVTALGTAYQNDVKKGLLEERWVDRYENVRKRSGAYSSGCYDSMPYILMNYHGTFSDVTTLAHEMGHSMHSLLSCRHQPFHYSQYPIFVAEVASTFNEELLFRHLLAKVKKPEERTFLINQKIEDLRTTLFRQAMFAEFELKLHTWAEQGIPFTPSLLKEEYRKLNQDYFGPDLIIDEEIDIEWARIPHFYYNFYVYQYATGISAAHALVEKVQKEGEPARKRYLEFLSSGSSRYPLDLLALAGVDMRKPDAVLAAINHFDQLVAELDR